MKKYNIKIKRNGHTFGEYNSKEEASDKLMAYIRHFNDSSDGGYISPFDFELEEVELSTADLIPDFESAKRYLNLKEPNEKNSQALVALNELFTIADAWNKADGFVPDLSDLKQEKWFPWFEYEKKVACLVCVSTYITRVCAGVYPCYRLCFKTEARAKQFGKKFAHLYNKVFL